MSECDVMGGDGCYRASYDYEVMQYDCINDEWLKDTYSGDRIYSCCSDSYNCNNRTTEDYLDESCSSSNYLRDIYIFEQGCAYSQRNLYSITSDQNLIRAAFCGDDLFYEDFLDNDGEEDKEKLCELLKVRWQYDHFCDCNLAKLKIAGVESPEGTVEDSARIVRMMKADFWNGVGSTYLSELEAMWEYWSCSDYESDATASFFTCDFEQSPEALNNRGSAFRRGVFGFALLIPLFALFSLIDNMDRQNILILTLFA